VEEQLRHDALHDALTGLPNRLLFMERLAHALVRSKRREDFQFAVLFLDLDRFKVVNDSLGHHVGDELLTSVAARLLSCLRPSDTVARFGGDEFVILLEEISGPDDATRVADRIRAELVAPIVLEGFEVFTSVSVGIALSSSSYQRPEYLLRNADMAMYRAKARGTAGIEIFDRAMHAAALVRLQMESDLRRALEREEFTLAYQPIVSLDERRVTGVEALIRWEHPERGRMSPDEFIPVAEENGLITPIGQWVLGAACRQMADWRTRLGATAPRSMAVNLSTRQLSEPDLVERVSEAVASAGIPPEALRLEITESAIMQNADTAVVLLRRLKDLGVGISLDDFGTGYSSLSYLHRFPLDTLKIDRSFVGRIDQEPRSANLVQTILTLAASLGVKAVAEGVENRLQLQMLHEMGCALGQGYHFSRPLDPADLEAMLLRDPRRDG
jgi:diguanylate cyclase (GGDEF)-like protein